MSSHVELLLSPFDSVACACVNLFASGPAGSARLTLYILSPGPRPNHFSRVLVPLAVNDIYIKKKPK